MKGSRFGHLIEKIKTMYMSGVGGVGRSPPSSLLAALFMPTVSDITFDKK